MIKKVLNFKWSEIGDAYQSFSTMSDEGDWQLIISQIATIIAKSASGSRNILDYGAGLGTTAASIRRQLYGVHGLLSSWSLYEPDSFARATHQVLMPQVGKYMPVNSLAAPPKSPCFDIVLFIHTSYYLSEFDKELEKIFNSLLSHNNGFVICVSMPKESPFFVPELNNHISWSAQEIIETASSIGLQSEIIKLRSRFRWLPTLGEDQLLSKSIASFVCGGRDVSDHEINLVENKLSGEVDFGDWMIVIRR